MLFTLVNTNQQIFTFHFSFLLIRLISRLNHQALPAKGKIADIPNGRKKKNGSQHRMNIPTTMARVLAAFFSLENFIRRTESELRNGCLLLSGRTSSIPLRQWIRSTTSTDWFLSRFMPASKLLVVLRATTYTRKYMMRMTMSGR